jgi:hypothetical protein
MSITRSVIEWVTLIAYCNLDNAGTLSGSKGGSILVTFDTFCIQDIVNIWTGESFFAQDKAPSVNSRILNLTVLVLLLTRLTTSYICSRLGNIMQSYITTLIRKYTKTIFRGYVGVYRGQVPHMVM